MKRTLFILTILGGIAFTGCKSNDVIIINNPPAQTGASNRSASTTSSTVRRQGKTDPKTIEPVKAPSTFSNP